MQIKTTMLWIGIVVAIVFFAGPAIAKEDKSMGLFTNVTTFATGPAGQVVHMAEKQMERGHPVTFVLNSKAVYFAS